MVAVEVVLWLLFMGGVVVLIIVVVLVLVVGCCCLFLGLSFSLSSSLSPPSWWLWS